MRCRLAEAAAAVALVAACAPVSPHAQVAAAQHAAAPPPRPTASPGPQLVAWRGPVEQLFVHPLVLQPRLAFTPDKLGRGFADYFVTAREFRRILDSLWRNGWTLVDPHRVAAGHVLVPAGRRPLVLQEDDVDYYRYFTGRGLADRLVVDAGGHVHAEAAGRLTDDDVVPLVDEEVARHPAFSAAGAKGLLATTAYEGFFGEHDLGDAATRERVRHLAAVLRADGWTIASHTFGHIDLSRDSLPVVARDTARWRAAAAGLLGPTDILVYPFGARPDAAARRLLRDDGFTIQYDIDTRPARRVVDGVVVMSRRHVDGYAFDDPRALAPFFDVAAVRDPRRPH
jgi:hypothetical protein